MPTTEPEIQECKLCKKRLKTAKGSKYGLQVHVARHAKDGERVDRDELKSWLVASMVANLNIPCRAFGSPTMRILFSLAKLGPISEQIARDCADKEAA